MKIYVITYSISIFRVFMKILMPSIHKAIIMNTWKKYDSYSVTLRILRATYFINSYTSYRSL